MADRNPLQELAGLFKQAGKAHHRAFKETDGADPDWPLWYAEFLHDKLPDVLGTELTRSQLVYFLIEADKRHAASTRDAPWPRFYARMMLRQLDSAD